MSAPPSDASERLQRARRTARCAMPVVLALAIALILRHAVVEPAAVAHACDPAPWAGWCAARTLLVYGFATQGIGWLSLAAGVLATLRRPRRIAQLAIAQLAIAAGSAGLVLYSFEPAAAGALLGLMVLVRAPSSPDALPRRGQPKQAAT
ncbi:MAG TPA: hypothetical protein VK052_05615 [Zeimonas sp.]|nr:hypothetical protein [Zeimonas sp.]